MAAAGSPSSGSRSGPATRPGITHVGPDGNVYEIMGRPRGTREPMAVQTPLTAAATPPLGRAPRRRPGVWGRPFAAAGPGCSSSSSRRRSRRRRSSSPASASGSSGCRRFASTARPRPRRSSPPASPRSGSLDDGPLHRRSTTNIAGRVGAIEATVLGDRKPYAGRHWLKTLIGLERTRLWWARTGAVEEYEDALFGAFAEGIPPDERARLHAAPPVLPFANLRLDRGRAQGSRADRLPRPGGPGDAEPANPRHGGAAG